MHRNVLVCVTQQKTCENLIRLGVKLLNEVSSDGNSNLYVIHVVNEKDKLLYNLSDGDAIEYLFEITKEVGASLVVKRSKDVIQTIADFALEKEITHVVIGSSNVQDSSKSFLGKLKRKLFGVEIIM